LNRIILPVVLLLLSYSFWRSPDFKEIAAGVAIFLFGMLSLEEGFKAFTGGLLEKLLHKTTDKRWKSVSFGVISTTIMQSSSLVSVITISFLSAGLITLASGIGIIFGANLGTTTGAWLVAAFGMKVKISAYAMPMIVFGVIFIFQSSRQLKGIGYVLTGLGFLFLGIHYMKEGFEAFKDSIDLTAYAIDGYKGLLVFTLIGMAATVVMQSSHATLVLIITALAAQQISYENALALAIGANLGTTVTAIIGALGANVDGRRLAAAHLIFNLVTAAITIAFLFQLTELVDTVCGFVGIALDNYTLKLAVFHSIFNTIGIVVMLPFVNQLVRLLQRLLKAKNRSQSQPLYLHESTIELVDTAIAAVQQELIHLYDNAREVLAGTLRLSVQEIISDAPLAPLINSAHTRRSIDIDEAYNTNIKGLHGEIIEYISRIRPSQNQDINAELFALRGAGRDIVEAIKSTKHLQKNLNINISSANVVLRKEYNELRLDLANLIRELELVRIQPEDESHILALDNLRLEMKERDNHLNERIDLLIREKQINSHQATSLMNDSHYAFSITEKLVDMASILFTKGAISYRVTQRELALDSIELAVLNSETAAKTTE